MKRTLGGILVFLTLATVLVSTAGAGWQRFADGTSRTEDIAVCPGFITLELAKNFFPGQQLPDPLPPTRLVSDRLALQSDLSQEYLIEGEVPVALDDAGNQLLINGLPFYRGDVTLSGLSLSAGDVLVAVNAYVPEGDFPTVVVGDPIYDCPAEVGDLDATLLAWNNQIRVGARSLYFVRIDTPDVDLSTVAFAADGGPAIDSARTSSSRFGTFAAFRPNSVGISCDTSELVVTASTTTGDLLETRIAITPTGRSCR